MAKTGKEIAVNLILANQPYVHHAASDSASPAHVLGHDGNQYYCQVCSGFGDVVCCDGCPRVYHPECVPLQSMSRKSLDNDDDPWYCPKCIGKSKLIPKGRRPRVEKGDRTSSLPRCADCMETRPELSLAPCTGCGSYVHSPACSEEASHRASSSKLNTVVCLNCRAIDDDKGLDEGNEKSTNMHEDYPDDYEGEMAQTNGGSPHRGSDAEIYDDEGDGNKKRDKRPRQESDADIYDDEGDGTKKRAKRKKSPLSPTNDARASEKKLKKKKKKKRKRSMSSEVLEDDAARHERHEPMQEDPVQPPRSTGVVQATPAFCFYLAENRWKIERALSRKHRTFNRLPKGDERNALVAQEAAVWWTKLPPMEHHRYINMSMREFEARVIKWKEETNAKEVGSLDYANNDENQIEGELAGDAGASDGILTYEMHDRLYLSTSVGSKPFKLEPDQSYNRVLLDLLHDIRFHPLPMFSVNRPENDGVIDDHSSKVTIPFFEVHGPISTSIGDECLGCSRGWTHYCPVIQRRVPAVEHRAKLQPPLSSLLATRVGLGLRPRLQSTEDAESGVTKAVVDNGKGDLLQWKESDLFKELKSLPVVSSCSAFDPKDRADDMVLFIEETAAMKIPEPPRPTYPDKNQQKKSIIRTLPTQRQRDNAGGVDESGESLIFNKCGRCRTIIANDTGCVQCRRAQLVINKSKKVPSGSPKGEGKSLKVHTTMLGRIQIKEGTGETQSKADIAVSDAILRERWCPSSILPPQKMYAPSPNKLALTKLGDVEEGADDSLDSSGDELAVTEELSVDEYEPALVSREEPTVDERKPALANSPLQNAVDEPSNDELPAKRARSTRVLTMMFKEVVEPEPDRQQVLKHHKKEASELQKKTVQIACYGILLALMRRDPLHLFAQPVTAEGYSAVVQNPIDLGKIRENVLAGKYTTLGAFVSDARLLCENALAYNPPASIYFKTANEIDGVLAVMQTRASDWMATIKGAHASFLQRREVPKRNGGVEGEQEDSSESISGDAFEELRKTRPEDVQMLENGESLRRMIASDFMRTKENETAFYGSLAIRRVAAAAEASLAPYTDSGGLYSVVAKRQHYEDEVLRDHVDAKVAAIGFPQLKNVSNWREESVVRLVRKVQKLRLERKTTSENGCSRCDGTVVIDAERKTAALNSELINPVRPKKKGELDFPRVVPSRVILATGLASAKTCLRIVNRNQDGPESGYDDITDACVSVRGSKVHGMGLFADQPFSKGDVVAEYIGEYVVNPVADEREKVYGEQRIQDYQFRLDDKLVIDATTKGGPGRYINHNCTPNCKALIIPGKEPNPHLRRVMVVAQRSIDLNEEISYDYQFPLELDLSARIPCNCQSDACRGFMNWDLPEKGSNNRALLVQKRGANMRDRIRRLGRPLKRDEV
jgi:Bromodomain/SET domain/PHD-finger